MRLLRWLLLGIMPFIASCTPAQIVNDLVPDSGYELTSGQPYEPGPRHTLDIYRPSKATGPSPVVIFIYGGGWTDGDKATYRFVGQALASRGYVTVIPDYRLVPEVKFPAFLKDNADAVAWVHAHIGGFGGDPGKLFLMGHSAGAYNAAMLTVDPQWLAAVGLDPGRDIKGLVALSGPYDFLPFDHTTEPVFGAFPDPKATQPVDVISGGLTGHIPPMLLANGLDDHTVRPVNAVSMGGAVRTKGGEATVKLYPGVDHIGMVGALAAPLHYLAPTLDDTMAFLAAHR